jgi:hypothetical protein
MHYWNKSLYRLTQRAVSKMSIAALSIGAIFSCGHPDLFDNSNLLEPEKISPSSTQPSQLSISDDLSLLPIENQTVELDFQVIEASSQQPPANTRERIAQQLRPSSFVIAIKDCASNFTKIHNTAIDGTIVQLIKSDSHCTAALRSFVLFNKTFTRLGGGDFSGPGLATFIDASQSQSFVIANPVRLSTPLSKQARVIFSIPAIQSGKNVSLIQTGEAGFIRSESGSQAPLLKWYSGASSFALSNVMNGDIPIFKVKLECSGRFWKVESKLTNSLCLIGNTPQAVGNYYLRLVEDHFDNGRLLTLADARKIFGHNGVSQHSLPNAPQMVRITESQQVIQPDVNSNGGIRFQIAASTPLSSCRNYLLLVLFSPSGNTLVRQWSFAYFNADFAEKSSSCPKRLNTNTPSP